VLTELCIIKILFCANKESYLQRAGLFRSPQDSTPSEVNTWSQQSRWQWI